jgi:hypothetical protein
LQIFERVADRVLRTGIQSDVRRLECIPEFMQYGLGPTARAHENGRVECRLP